MIKRLKLILVLLLLPVCSFSSDIKSIEFTEKDIKDVLMIIAEESSLSIYVDDDVTGTVTLKVYGEDWDRALQEIANLCRLKIESDGNVRRIKKNPPGETPKYLTKKNGLYSAYIKNCQCSDLLKELFTLENMQYSLFLDSDGEIKNLKFTERDFSSALSLILEQANCDYVLKDDVYYVVNLSKNKGSNNLRKTEIFNPEKIAASDLYSMIPQELNGCSIHIEKNRNIIIATGTEKELKNLGEIISMLEKSEDNMSQETVLLKHVAASKIEPVLNQNFKTLRIQKNLYDDAVILTGTFKDILEAKNFINELDVSKNYFPVELKYISPEELMENLPPEISKEEIIKTGRNDLIFYTGSADKKNDFVEKLKYIDREKPLIKYTLLIIEYTKNKSTGYKPELKLNSTKESGSYLYGVNLSNILSLNFDVVSKLGLSFAASLNEMISAKEARVFTDTTLTGLSGEQIRFQNTDTSRYMEYEYDKNTGTTANATTQEITSGLIVSLKGWISGDNMITMDIDATISKQNSESNPQGSWTSLPSTSERIVNTCVRAKNGESVIISGLVKEDDSNLKSGSSIFMHIPVLGKIFSQSSDAREKTEIHIYIVPSVVEEKREEKITAETVYNKIFVQ